MDTQFLKQAQHLYRQDEWLVPIQEGEIQTKDFKEYMLKVEYPVKCIYDCCKGRDFLKMVYHLSPRLLLPFKPDPPYNVGLDIPLEHLNVERCTRKLMRDEDRMVAFLLDNRLWVEWVKTEELKTAIVCFTRDYVDARQV